MLLGNSQAEIVVFSLGLTGFFYANFLELPLKGKTLAGFYLILSMIQEVSIGNFPSAAWLTIPTNCVFLIIVFNLKQLHIGHDASRAVIIVNLHVVVVVHCSEDVKIGVLLRLGGVVVGTEHFSPPVRKRILQPYRVHIRVYNDHIFPRGLCCFAL